MRRFQWKVVSLMILVSALPLVSSAVVVDQLLKDTVALGLDQRVSTSLDRSAEVYRNYISLRKQVIPLHLDALAADPALRDALDRDDLPAARALLTHRAEAFDAPDQGIARLALLPAASPSLQDAEAAPPGALVIDRRQRFPAPAWRVRTLERPLATPGWRLSATYALPDALLTDYQALGDVQRTFLHMERRQSALAEGYLRTFLLIALAILGVTFGLGVLLARGTTRRIALLTEGTTRVARGDLDLQLPVDGHDEIAQLTANFNQMVIELRQARGRLAYLERVSAWQEIARRLAHEIKNPLTPILLAVQQLDRKFDDLHTDPPRYRRLVSTAMEIVSEEVDSLRRLVAEFSDFARLPSVQPQPTALRPWLEEVLRTNPQFHPWLLPPDLTDAPLVADLDPLLMRRVLINLLQNACDALGDPNPGLTLRLRPAPNGGALIEVEDSGEGITPDALPRLFDPYFTTKEHGTGLGLSIVKKIVIEHGGDIDATSPLPDGAPGARFSLWLPQREPGPAELSPYDTHRGEGPR